MNKSFAYILIVDDGRIDEQLTIYRKSGGAVNAAKDETEKMADIKQCAFDVEMDGTQLDEEGWLYLATCGDRYIAVRRVEVVD